MRPLEFILPCLLALALLWAPGARLISGLVVAVLLLHLLIERYRWQMVPLYVLSAALCLPSLTTWNRFSSTSSPGTALGGVALLLVLVALATALPWLMPVPRLPTPTGRYRVGTITRVLIDEKRRELYSGVDEPRRFVIQVWYPATPPPGEAPAPWMPNARQLGRLIAAWLRMPPFFLDHLGLVQSRSYPGAALDRSARPYPVLVFSHGWGGFRAQNTYQTEELASHGYVVVGMEHPYGSMLTLFPDGRIARNNPAALPYKDPKEEYLPAARKLAAQWAGDIAFALDKMAELNLHDRDGRFTDSLDANKIGLFGHSTGAGAMLQFMGTDPRPKAGFAEDVYLAPVSADVLDAGLSQPLTFMFSQIWANDEASENNNTLRALERRLTGPHAVMSIRGTTHHDFTDLPALSPLAHVLGLKGPINGKRVHSIVNAYSLAFFDQYLKGRGTATTEGGWPDFPEVLLDDRLEAQRTG